MNKRKFECCEHCGRTINMHGVCNYDKWCDNALGFIPKKIKRDDSVDAKVDALRCAIKPVSELTFDFNKMKTDDMVNHPRHYKAKNGMEAIDVIESFTDGLNGIEATDTGNIIKYALRWKDKNGVEDIKKIVWYANHLINHLEGNDSKLTYNGNMDVENPDRGLSVLEHFKCPRCNGNIVREEKPTTIGDFLYNPDWVWCSKCGVEVIIKFHKDLSFEVEITRK